MSEWISTSQALPSGFDLFGLSFVSKAVTHEAATKKHSISKRDNPYRRMPGMGCTARAGGAVQQDPRLLLTLVVIAPAEAPERPRAMAISHDTRQCQENLTRHRPSNLLLLTTFAADLLTAVFLYFFQLIFLKIFLFNS